MRAFDIANSSLDNNSVYICRKSLKCIILKDDNVTKEVYVSMDKILLFCKNVDNPLIRMIMPEEFGFKKEEYITCTSVDVAYKALKFIHSYKEGVLDRLPIGDVFTVYVMLNYWDILQDEFSFMYMKTMDNNVRSLALSIAIGQEIDVTDSIILSNIYKLPVIIWYNIVTDIEDVIDLDDKEVVMWIALQNIPLHHKLNYIRLMELRIEDTRYKSNILIPPDTLKCYSELCMLCSDSKRSK